MKPDVKQENSIRDRDWTMKTLVYAFAAAIAIGAFNASTVEAMTLGSLSRAQPRIASAKIATLAFPAVCHDPACGVRSRKTVDVAPVAHVILASISGFVRSHVAVAFGNGQVSRVQLISIASAD
jgi:hypothetical protein